ncbi:segregation and condensation protein A [Streptomyces flavochromogenes]|uniref:segregation and condensation protein A n=1 Tax=Streptomyces flavochromogenes TaxID=68199 RepID=UPI00099B64E4|nr:segregation/condensation protein A [Streptomyces flavochromogenes]
MHHASDETSRPPRRRALGRGPGEPEGPAAAPAAGEVRDGHGAVPGADGDADAAGSGVPTEPATGLGPGSGPESGPTPESEDGPEDGPTPEPEPTPESESGPTPESGPTRESGPTPESGSTPESGLEVEAGPAVGSGSGPRPESGSTPEAGDGRFTVRLANFEGPFDLLLQLITKHKLDVTEVALSQVTDEFMAHLRALGPDGDLDQTTEFLVVAATLLDLKAARLLPAAEVEDEADLALLEARDLLFARLLQYRAYKRIAAIFEERWEAEGRRHPRTVGLEPHHAELLPEVVISIGAEGFARLAVKAMQPRAEPQVYVDHIHAPLVSVREQAAVVVSLLRERGTALFRELIEDVGDDTLTVVARFLALLELYREKAVALDQETALGDLTVSWTGGETDPTGAVTDEFDQETTQETTA